MNCIFLGGNSHHNQQWIEDVQKRIGGGVQMYRHWKTGESMIDFDHEASVLATSTNGESITVFAKSAGCLVAMKAVRELDVKIDRAVFVGFPYYWGIEKGIDVATWLKEWNVSTVFVQKEHDPVIGGEELREMLPAHVEVIVIPGENHEYGEFEGYLGKAGEFLKRSDLSLK